MGRSGGRQRGLSVAAYGEIPMAAVSLGSSQALIPLRLVESRRPFSSAFSRPAASTEAGTGLGTRASREQDREQDPRDPVATGGWGRKRRSPRLICMGWVRSANPVPERCQDRHPPCPLAGRWDSGSGQIAAPQAKLHRPPPASIPPQAQDPRLRPSGGPGGAAGAQPRSVTATRAPGAPGRTAACGPALPARLDTCGCSRTHARLTG
jgi:hypothetical protein